MKINSINAFSNYNEKQNNQNFKAKLSSKDINLLLEDANEYGSPAIIPKIYTLLKYLDELPGEKAFYKITPCSTLKTYNNLTSHMVTELQTDANVVLSKKISKFKEFYKTLVESCVGDESSKHLRMPEQIFEQEWWKNRHKSLDDILEMARDK